VSFDFNWSVKPGFDFPWSHSAMITAAEPMPAGNEQLQVSEAEF
jgi:hypothetical protein